MTSKVLVFLSFVAAFLVLSNAGWARQGNAQRGEALYVGTVGFSAGGAPCLACHGIAGHDLGLAGASFGPDLTSIHEDFGAEGVADVLSDLSVFPSMEAIFAGHPLTDAESADLRAFFAEVPAGETMGFGPKFISHVVLGTAVFLCILGLLGWRRLQGVRRPLVERFRNRKGGQE